MKDLALVICPPFWTKTPPFGLEYLKNSVKDIIAAEIYDLNIYFFTLLQYSSGQWLQLNKNFEKGLFSSIKKNYPNKLEGIINNLAEYTYVGFSIFRRNFPFSLELAKEITKKSPSAKIIFGGPQTQEIENFPLHNSAVIKGEGEIPLRKIILGESKNIFKFQEKKNLDNLPFLTFRDFRLERYKPILPLLASRGCIKKCKFCSEWNLYKKFRLHSPDYIIDQIKYLTSRYKIYNFSFQDSLLNADLKWLKELCLKTIKNNLNITWEAQMIIRNDMSPEVLKLIKESGCINLFIGLESASDKVLKDMGKGFTLREATEFLFKLKKSGLEYEVSLITGYPTEKKQDFKKTDGFLKHNKFLVNRIAQISAFSLYKNSLLYKNSPKMLPRQTINKRLKKLTKTVEKEKIPHKKAFFDNLRYKDGN